MTVKESRPEQGQVLIVDDDPGSLAVLSDILSRRGHTVRGARNGPEALTVASAEAPDLILLDVRMPHMDGFEVCQRLKSDAQTRDIPVIFISVLDDIRDKVKGFEVGGVDYITKPVQLEEVLARVQTHLALRNAQKSLKEKNDQLLQEFTERTRVENALFRYAERLKVLHKIDQSILTSQSPEDIAEAAVRHIRRLVPCQRASVRLFDFAANEAAILSVDDDAETGLESNASYRLEPFANEIAQLRQGKMVAWDEPQSQGKSLAQSTVAGIGPFIGLPLISQDELIGVLTLSAKTPETRFTQEHQTIARQMADHLAIAIQQAELYAQIQRYSEELEQRVADRTRELAVLYEVASLASQSLELKTTLEQSLEQVLRAMRSEAGAIHLLSEAGGTSDDEISTGEVFRLAVQRGIPPGSLLAEIESLPADAGLGKLVAELDRPLVVADITSDPRVAATLSSILCKASQGENGADMANPVEPHSYVGIALRASGRTLGILSVVSRTRQPEHSVEELSLLISIADQLGLVVESERLRKQAEQAAVFEERERLARELHDSVTQLLYTVSLFATTGKGAFGSGDLGLLEHALNQLENASQQALKEMRLMLHELRPPVLAQLGLVRAIRRRLESVEGRVGVNARLLADQALEIPLEVEEELYRIALEALNNELKHSNAASVTVAIVADEEQIELRVIDDGVGFDGWAVQAQGGQGLINMRQRAERLGGALRIVSAPGAGTQVVVIFPY